jgi:hypothetical protein
MKRSSNDEEEKIIPESLRSNRLGESDDCGNSGNSTNKRRKKNRANYSNAVTKILVNWFKDHLHHPYPLEEERRALCESTGLSRKQLRVWFIDTRRVS